MAKSTKCKLICNAKNGYCFAPTMHDSVAEAVREATMGFWYRIYDMQNKLIKQGFCH